VRLLFADIKKLLEAKYVTQRENSFWVRNAPVPGNHPDTLPVSRFAARPPSGQVIKDHRAAKEQHYGANDAATARHAEAN
jgi:hypothetical protein